MAVNRPKVKQRLLSLMKQSHAGEGPLGGESCGAGEGPLRGESCLAGEGPLRGESCGAGSPKEMEGKQSHW